MKYITIDRILAKFHRDLKGTEISDIDLIEWAGEAFDFLDIYENQEDMVAYAKVKNHVAKLPPCLKSLKQIAKINTTSLKEQEQICNQIVEEEVKKEKRCCVVDECGERVEVIEKPPHWQWLFTRVDLSKWQKSNFYHQCLTPLRTSNHTFFTSVGDDKSPYSNIKDEYQIIQGINPVIKTSFKDGVIAIAYKSSRVDPKTGYPLIPDNISFITAVTYYIKWKIAEHRVWNKERGFVEIARDAEQHWLKYVAQAKSNMKMPKTADDYQDLLEETHNLVPNLDKYYGFFGNLGELKKENI